MIPSRNKTFQAQSKNLTPSHMKKGIISAINTQSFTVDVAFIKNIQTVVRSIPLAKSVDIMAIKVGDKCKVDIFDETNPRDMVVAYTY